MKNLLTLKVADTQVLYNTNDNGCVELSLYPAGLSPATGGREQLSPVAEVRVRGDAATGGFGGGRTMRFGGSAGRFRYQSQTVEDHRVTTVMADDRGYELKHILLWYDDCPVFAVHTEFTNKSQAPVTLDFMTSFILGGLAGYVQGDAYERLNIHRYRSAWSAEGRHICESVEDLVLEHSWGGGLMRAERFGQVGTMPVRGWHPFVALEDKGEGVFWGAQLAWSGSWQMEFVRYSGDTLSMDGGLADREFGHWSKVVAPGETFASPEAFLACRKGTFDELCQRLLTIQERRLDVPSVEEDLPVIFNEWCYSWGNPKESELLAAADRLKGTPVKYLVIDAGWYKEEGKSWGNTQGDWIYNKDLYPDGLMATADRIRERGLIPGIWFEAEVCGNASHAFTDDADLHLKLDGNPIYASGRHFLNLQLPEIRRKMDEKIVYFLKENHLGYIKIDYNETVGIGCDHPDSIGEGLRKQVEGTHWFFRRLREVNPDLVIENCASGGHRLEPFMMSLTSMSSFSDAHMEPEIPVIAANLHNLMLPRQCQIWAVLKPEYDDTKLRYILGGGMLGRLCLSGGITKLSDSQWSIVTEAMSFYEKIKGVIKHGESAYYPSVAPSWRHLRGGFALRRVSLDGKSAIAYFFAFNEAPSSLKLDMPEGDWTIADRFGEGEAVVDGATVTFTPAASMSCLILSMHNS